MGFGRKHSDWDAMVEALKKMQGERDALRLELEETKERLKTIGDHHARMMALPCQKCEASKKRAERLEGALREIQADCFDATGELAEKFWKICVGALSLEAGEKL